MEKLLKIKYKPSREYRMVTSATITPTEMCIQSQALKRGSRKVKLCGAQVLGFELSHFVLQSTVSAFVKELPPAVRGKEIACFFDNLTPQP